MPDAKRRIITATTAELYKDKTRVDLKWKNKYEICQRHVTLRDEEHAICGWRDPRRRRKKNKEIRIGINILKS